LGKSSADLTARESERLEHPFVAECRLLVELLVFTRGARWLAFFARSPIVVHSWSSQSIQLENLAYPPVLIRVKAVYYMAFSGASVVWAQA
jgi:hypothetical protein